MKEFWQDYEIGLNIGFERRFDMSVTTPTPSKGMGRSIAIVALVIVVVVAIAGYYVLSGMSSAKTTTSTTSPQRTNIQIASGTGSNNALNFNPLTVKVVIGANNTITWANGDSTTHSITFTSAPSGVSLASLTDPNNLNAGQSYTLTLTTPGTYQYHCTFHDWMHGTITVVQAT
jgi:plastocyanin